MGGGGVVGGWAGMGAGAGAGARRVRERESGLENWPTDGIDLKGDDGGRRRVGGLAPWCGCRRWEREYSRWLVGGERVSALARVRRNVDVGGHWRLLTGRGTQLRRRQQRTRAGCCGGTLCKYYVRTYVLLMYLRTTYICTSCVCAVELRYVRADMPHLGRGAMYSYRARCVHAVLRTSPRSAAISCTACAEVPLVPCNLAGGSGRRLGVKRAADRPSFWGRAQTQTHGFVK